VGLGALIASATVLNRVLHDGVEQVGPVGKWT
jgi:hypothetical protein